MTASPWPRRTDRLVLRRVRDADIGAMLAYRNRPDVWTWLLKTHVDEENFRTAWLATLDDPRDHSVVAEFDGAVIGSGSLDVVDGVGQDDAPPTRGCEGVIGYIIDPAHHGNGFATEITAALLAVAFVDLGLRRVTAGCYADNTGSWRVLERVGMRREQHGVEDSWHADLGWVDGFTYAMLRDEWQALGNP